jgi:hypothetical protein
MSLEYNGSPSISGNILLTPFSGQTVAITIAGSNTIGGSTYVDFIRADNTSVGATNNKKTFRINNTGVLEIINNGYTTTIFSLTDAGVLTTPGGGTSDIRTKNKIEYINDEYTTFINKLKPVKFEFDRYEGIIRHGFIAQDVLEIKPDLVLGDGDKDNGTYGLDYDGILALTVKALQESNLKIETLEKEISDIKALLNK